MVTKRSLILKETCSFQLHVCLSICKEVVGRNKIQPQPTTPLVYVTILLPPGIKELFFLFSLIFYVNSIYKNQTLKRKNDNQA